ncbi:hypothetical protein [Thalassotalea sp. PS06]|nr:hypothetical protein [Thalassotalea sp. PS06]
MHKLNGIGISVLLAVSLPTMAQENYEQEFTEEAPISFIESV